MTRRARYGVDAPFAFFSLLGTAGLEPALTLLAFRRNWRSRWLLLTGAAYLSVTAASFSYTTLRGKFLVWEHELDALALKGDEQALDLGCGRGAVLILLARRMTGGGHVTGVDIWQRQDQSGNTERAARANAEAEAVSGRVTLVTGDLRDLALPDASADVVVSSMVVHNIASRDEREAAIKNAYRVLRPGGRLRIADFRHTDEYAATLESLGSRDVSVRSLGWRFWYGSPSHGASMVSAVKPDRADPLTPAG